ncbi:MAG: 4-alpha-glucanotransferase [Pseudomonadota bacterium]
MPATKKREAANADAAPGQEETVAVPVAESSILPAERRAGVCQHITSLPGPYGIGEIGQQALDFVDTLSSLSLSVWQFLPTGPTAYGDSPYQPLSTFAGNELLIDIGDLVALGMLDEREVVRLAELPSSYVDYGRLIPIKTELLTLAASRFRRRADASLKTDYEGFVDRHDSAWLHNYALFRILKSQHGQQAWPTWEPKFVHRDPRALERLEKDAAELVESIKITQFLFHHQWQKLRAYANERGIMLFGDMPICIALDSADAWANRRLLNIDRDGHPSAVAGVPPDYFSDEGQLWGNPLYDWDTHAATGYQWWIDRLAASAELADIVRIDHFRGFEAYWAVPPDSATAKDGEWRTGPGDAIFDAMQAALGSLPIVAENLGVITPEVEALRYRHSIPGMQVLQFDVTDPDIDISAFEENSVCYTGTHDNDTTLGWFHGSPADRRSEQEIRDHQRMALEVTGGTPETIHLDMIATAYASRSRLAIAPMQDFLGLGSEARFNRPGSSADNWRWRLEWSQLTPEIRDCTAQMIVDHGRALAE